MNKTAEAVLDAVLPPPLVKFTRKVRKFRRSLKHGQLVDGPLTYNQDGLATQHNCDFMQDERFARAYQAGSATGSWYGCAIHWRAHVLCWAADKASRLPGDFVECGVNLGGFSRMIIDYVGFPQLNKRFWLLDTFCGFDPEFLSEHEARQTQEFKYQECLTAVRETFRDFPQVTLVPGPVPRTLPQVTAEQVAFLSIDMNCAQPELAATAYFWDRLSPGAVVVFDDYGFRHHHEQKHALDQFAAEHGVQILSMPTGQGVLIKP